MVKRTEYTKGRLAELTLAKPLCFDAGFKEGHFNGSVPIGIRRRQLSQQRRGLQGGDVSNVSEPLCEERCPALNASKETVSSLRAFFGESFDLKHRVAKSGVTANVTTGPHPLLSPQPNTEAGVSSGATATFEGSAVAGMTTAHAHAVMVRAVVAMRQATEHGAGGGGKRGESGATIEAHRSRYHHSRHDPTKARAICKGAWAGMKSQGTCSDEAKRRGFCSR